MPDTHALHGVQTVAYEPPQALHLLRGERRRSICKVCVCVCVCWGEGEGKDLSADV